MSKENPTPTGDAAVAEKPTRELICDIIAAIADGVTNGEAADAIMEIVRAERLRSRLLGMCDDVRASEPTKAWASVEALTNEIADGLRNGQFLFGTSFGGPIVDQIASIAAHIALTRPRPVDEGAVERVARFLYARPDDDGDRPALKWEQIAQFERDGWTEEARAILAAAAGAE